MKKQWMKRMEELPGKIELLTDEPMSRHTTFRIGGCAEAYIEPEISQVADIIAICKEEEIPVYIIGNGSNLLVSDQGLPGLVISFGKNANQITVENDVITVEAGAMLSRTASLAAEHALTGMEFAAGIPGSIGGAVVMNAGAYGGEMKDILVEATVLTSEGNVQTLSVDELQLSYRHSVIMDMNAIVLSAKLRLEKGSRDDIQARMNELRDQRVSKQPLNFPSAGSTFKRPEGYFAGKLIMDAGLRGYSVGGAQVSEKHCGFVVNTGNATASDVKQLMDDVSDKVFEQVGVKLEPEVKMLGEFS